MTPLDTLLDLLDHGADGEPRWLSLSAADADAAADLVRAIAGEAERRGYVPVAADRLHAVLRSAEGASRHRTFALLQTASAGDEPPDLSALMNAAAFNPRPHVLITVAVGRRRTQAAPVLREARASYTARTEAPASAAATEAQRFLARALEALALARTGRHEPAVRMLREIVAALARRREGRSAATAGVLLGRLLLERGRIEDATAAFAGAVGDVERVDAGEAAVARVWMALARIDGQRLSDAEGLLRAIRLARVLPDPLTRRWADAALARCLLLQDRWVEAAGALEDESPFAEDADPARVVPILVTHARVRAGLDQVFQAGQLARAALERAERASDPTLALIAGLAQLRVLAATGDTGLAGRRTTELVGLARQQHLPLHALRARLIWAQMLRRAGRPAEASRELRACARLARGAPELLQRRVRQLAADQEPRQQRPVAGPDRQASFSMELLRAVQDEDEDLTAVEKALARVCEELRAGRLELQTAAGGALAALASAGTGLASRIGQRVLEAGISLGPEQRDGVWHAGAPVRSRQRVLAALTCRWPLGRAAPPGAAQLLELTAAVLAPRIEIVLARRSEAAQATLAVPELLGASEAIADVKRAIARAASAPFAVLVEGESGSGKELVARAIHHLSARRDRRFCDVNCAALPDELADSELFGHARGAFTGALVERRGLFEDASGGTLFLDELPDLSPRAQAKLLRVLQQGEIRRVGETFTRRVDVRLVTATNRPMDAEVAAGRFRQDLLYRLDVIRIAIPPLRERPEDVPILAQHFWTASAERAGTRAALSHAVLGELARYAWPGNVRELQNVVAALAVAAPARGLVRPGLLPRAITGAISVTSTRLADARRQFERRFIEVALARAGGSRTRAAAQLGVSRQGLLKLMARLGLRAPADGEAT